MAHIDDIEFDTKEIILLETATNYYRVDRYPNPSYFLPSKDEIQEVLDFTEKLFDKVCKTLDINKNELREQV